MKKTSLAFTLLAVATLAACTSTTKKKKSSSVTSVSSLSSATKTGTSYTPYSGSGGVDVDHITGISIDPSKDFYCQVNDTQVIKPSYSPSSKIPDNEKPITWELDDPTLADLTVNETTWEATLVFKKGGDLKITAHSIEDRYQRSITAHILENSDRVEIYQTTDNTDQAKANFGYVKEFYTKGDADGIAAFGKTTWQFHRDNPGEIATMSGALKFGGTNNTPSETNNEGKLTLETSFSRKVEKIVFNVSSTAATDTSSDYGFGGQSKLDVGSATVKATINGVELDRTVGETLYPAGSECNTPKYTQTAATGSVVIDCKNQSGQFIFELGASVAATYFQSIIITYTESFTPATGDEKETSFSFSNLTFDSALETSYKTKTADDPLGLVGMNFSSIRKGTNATSGYMNINKSSTITITPKTSGYSFKEVEITVANWITNPGESQTVKDVNAVINESYTSGIMYTTACSLEKGGTGSVPSSTTSFANFHIGTNLIQINNSSNGLGLISMRIKLDNAYPYAEVNSLDVVGNPHKVNYEYESEEAHDTFNPKGLLVKASFNSNYYSPICLNENTVWGDLEVGKSSIGGVTPFGNVEYSGVNVINYVGKKWSPISFATSGTYLLTCIENKTLYPGNSPSADDLRDKTKVQSLEGLIDGENVNGNYNVDHAFIYLTLNKENSKYVGVERFIFRTASYIYFNGVTTAGAMSYSTSSKQYVAISFDTDGNAILKLTKVEKNESGDDEGRALDTHIFGVLDGVFGFYPTGTANVLPVKLMSC